MSVIEVGKTLPNGATVLAHKPGDRGYEIVLAFVFPQISEDPFVTWSVTPEGGEAFWGHYYQDIAEALDDYKERT